MYYSIPSPLELHGENHGGYVAFKFNNAPNQWLGIGKLHFKNIDARFQSPSYFKIPKFILHYKYN